MRSLRAVVEAEIPLDGAADHGVSEALYLRDPDENGVELYWDRPREAWPRAKNGELAMYTRPLDVRALLREAQAAVEARSPGTGRETSDEIRVVALLGRPNAGK